MNYITNGIEIVALEVFMKVLEQNWVRYLTVYYVFVTYAKCSRKQPNKEVKPLPSKL